MIMNFADSSIRSFHSGKKLVSILKRPCQNTFPSEEASKVTKKVNFSQQQQLYSYLSIETLAVKKGVKSNERPTLSNISNSYMVQNKYPKIKTQKPLSARCDSEVVGYSCNTSDDQVDSPLNITLENKFKQIFICLDIKKVGYISKDNCQTSQIKDQIKYFIGTILSKVKHDNLTLSLDQFVLQGKEAISTLSQAQKMQFLDSKTVNSKELISAHSKLSRSNISSNIIQTKTKAADSRTKKAKVQEENSSGLLIQKGKKSSRTKTHRSRQLSQLSQLAAK